MSKSKKHREDRNIAQHPWKEFQEPQTVYELAAYLEELPGKNSFWFRPSLRDAMLMWKVARYTLLPATPEQLAATQKILLLTGQYSVSWKKRGNPRKSS